MTCSRPRLPRVSVCWIVVAIVGILLATTVASVSAYGATTHEFAFSFDETSLGATLSEPQQIAIDHVDGRVFVTDPGAGVVDVFTEAGSFVTQLGDGLLIANGVGIDEATGDVYVSDVSADAVLVYKPSGPVSYALLSEWTGRNTPSGAFGEVGGVAVDNSGGASAGDVYVIDERAEGGHGAVEVLESGLGGLEEGIEGGFVRSLTHKFDEPNDVAVNDATGEVLVADSRLGAVYRFGPEGTLTGKLDGSGSPEGVFLGAGGEETGNVAAIAVDEATGDLLVAEGERAVVSEFDPAGEWVGSLGETPAGPLGQPAGVGATAAGDVFVADLSQARIDVFGPAAAVPDLTTGKASKQTRTSVVLNGTLNGEGRSGDVDFQWGPTRALGSSTPAVAFPGGEQKIQATLEGLQAGTRYFYRLHAEGEQGANQGLVHEFETLPAVEALATGEARQLRSDAALLTGLLTPGGVDAHYYFEWGLTSDYGNASSPPPGVDAGSGAAAVAAESEVGGLKPNTLYHYRLVATNGFGTTYGADRSFRTLGPPTVVEEPASETGHEEATLRAEVDPEQAPTTYRFEYGETSAYGNAVTGAAGSGDEPIPVSATLTGLKVGVTYHFRVAAESTIGTTYGPDQTFTTLPAAAIDSETATDINAGDATLHTEINPLGTDTSYYFQYGTQSCATSPTSCADMPASPEDIGAGQEDVARSVELSDLVAGTTYHYRVIAFNALGTSEGAEHAFTPANEALPDGRAWEMVSPPDKRGAPIEALTAEGGVILSSEDGDQLTYLADGALGAEVQGNRSPEWQQILATREPDGWVSRDIATPNDQAQGFSGGAPEYQFFSPDLSLSLVEPPGNPPAPPLAPEATQETMYLRNDATGAYVPLITAADVAPGTSFGGAVRFVGASSDLSHVVVEAAVPLQGRGSPREGLYEWSAGRLQLVSVLPDATPSEKHADLGYLHARAGAISDDGTRVIWTAREEEAARGHLYMRDTTTNETVQLDKAQAGVKEPNVGSAAFQDANDDGSTVFFTDARRLTTDSTATTANPDLYECEMVQTHGKLACDLRDLTVDPNANEHADVQGMLLGMSEAGTTVYLVARGVLAQNENGDDEVAQPNADNLYELHFGEGAWTTVYVATLSNEDSPEWSGGGLADAAFVTASVSPDGRYFAFMSSASLTGYDNFDLYSGQRDEEVYLYDAGSESLRCVSCDPDGSRPAGVYDQIEAGEGLGLLVDRRRVWVEHWLAGSIPGWTAESETGALFQPRYLDNEGRLYFDSPEELVPAADSGKESVYEYEPSGVGSCASSSGGCVALLSSGDSDNESAFLEATPSGDNVFFITAARLVPQDTDTALDIYDARECTATSPCLAPPEVGSTACAATETCRPATPAQQIPGGPAGSATASGAGDSVSQAQQPTAKHSVQAKKATKPLTRAQKLAAQLRTCRKRYPHARNRRVACERSARKRYGAVRKRPKKASRSNRRGR